jgi:hypothetical protein
MIAVISYSISYDKGPFIQPRNTNDYITLYELSEIESNVYRIQVTKSKLSLNWCDFLFFLIIGNVSLTGQKSITNL